MKKLLLSMSKYASMILFVFFGFILPLAILIVTAYILLAEGSFLFNGRDDWGMKTIVIMALVIMNIWSVFSIWLTAKTSPFKYTWEKMPGYVGLGMIIPTKNNPVLGITIPWFGVGIKVEK